MEQSEHAARRRTGRPLSFDRDAALRRAMLLFWRHGYEATSLSELTAAMGVTAPSVYAAFGDKRRLFLEAVGLYLSGPVTSERIIAEAATARDAAWGLLRAAAVGFTGADTPAGCLLASAAISCSAAAADVQAELAAIRRGIEARLSDRIARAIAAGEMPAGADADALAGHVMAVVQGMSTLARDGARRDKLLRVAAVAMAGWPAQPSGGSRSRSALGHAADTPLSDAHRAAASTPARNAPPTVPASPSERVASPANRSRPSPTGSARRARKGKQPGGA
jgi:AcrR family transcriptional regulator